MTASPDRSGHRSGQRAARLTAKLHAAMLQVSRGRLGSTFAGAPVLTLITTGRRTGRARSVPLLYLRDGDDLIVVGSNAGRDEQPAWFLNLLADRNARVAIGAARHDVEAQVVTGPERDTLWSQLEHLWTHYNTYQQRTSRPLPIVRLRRR